MKTAMVGMGFGFVALCAVAIVGTLGMDLATVEAMSIQEAPSIESVQAAQAEQGSGLSPWWLLAVPILFGTTLAADSIRPSEIGERNDFPVIAADIIYEGAAVGMVDGTGHTQPLANGNRFVGFCAKKADNSAGAAAAIYGHVVEKGKIQLSVTGAVITDVGQPVYASDDDTFTFNPVSGVFIGYVHRFVSAGVVIVAFNAPEWSDPYGYGPRVLKSANYTVDATDNGRTIFVDTDAVVITLPAVEGISGIKVVNIAAFGVSGVAVSPNAADMIEGPGITAADNKDLINTKATARRGDFIRIDQGDANGWSAVEQKGTWAREA